jgi:Uma2 family endonuclease
MVGAPLPLPATYRDVERAPETHVAELLDGRLVLRPRPAMLHAVAASNLGGLLIPPFRFGRGGPGGWVIVDEPELHLGGDVLVPDLAGWRAADLPDLQLTVPAVTVAPQWVCEVASPSTRRHDRLLKMPRYAAAGVQHLWLVEPEDQLIEVYRRDGDHWTRTGAYSGDEPCALEPFDAVPMVPGDLWRAF